jgi:hypothetical protein
MKAFLSEKNLVVVLFVMVLITFAFAQEASKKMEKAYIGFNASAASKLVSLHKPEFKTPPATVSNPSAADLSE